jgi:putative oxidoreductase
MRTINYGIKGKRSKNVFLLLFRAVLGIGLFAKGITFLRDKALIENLLSETATPEKLSFFEFLIPYLHLAGGFFILIGLYTRIAVLLQLPIIIGAVVLLFKSTSNFQQGEFVFALTILIMLVIQLINGDGFYTWRNLINEEKNIV